MRSTPLEPELEQLEQFAIWDVCARTHMNVHMGQVFQLFQAPAGAAGHGPSRLLDQLRKFRSCCRPLAPDGQP